MVVTISREYGAAGLAVAELVVERLGYTLVHDQLPTIIAARFGTTPDVVEAISHARAPIGERILTAFGDATPEVAGRTSETAIDVDVRRAMEDEIRRYAAAGDCVILGRFGSRSVGRGPHAIRVFLHAPRPWRIAHLQEAFGVDERAARREVERMDDARRAYAREHYAMIFADAREYDVTLDVARLGIEPAAALIAAAARDAHESAR